MSPALHKLRQKGFSVGRGITWAFCVVRRKAAVLENQLLQQQLQEQSGELIQAEQELSRWCCGGDGLDCRSRDSLACDVQVTDLPDGLAPGQPSALSALVGASAQEMQRLRHENHAICQVCTSSPALLECPHPQSLGY